MYRYKYPGDVNKLLDGRSIFFVSQELTFNREKLSNILRGFELCNEKQAKMLVNRCRPNSNIKEYFIYCTESEVNDFYGKRD